MPALLVALTLVILSGVLAGRAIRTARVAQDSVASIDMGACADLADACEAAAEHVRVAVDEQIDR